MLIFSENIPFRFTRNARLPGEFPNFRNTFLDVNVMTLATQIITKDVFAASVEEGIEFQFGITETAPQLSVNLVGEKGGTLSLHYDIAAKTASGSLIIVKQTDGLRSFLNQRCYIEIEGEEANAVSNFFSIFSEAQEVLHDGYVKLKWAGKDATLDNATYYVNNYANTMYVRGGSTLAPSNYIEEITAADGSTQDAFNSFLAYKKASFKQMPDSFVKKLAIAAKSYKFQLNNEDVLYNNITFTPSAGKANVDILYRYSDESQYQISATPIVPGQDRIYTNIYNLIYG